MALFIPSLSGGGAERIMVALANSFSDRGFKVDLILVKAEGVYLKDVSVSVRVVDLAASRVLFALPALVCYLRREKPESLLSALNHANLVAFIAKKIAGVKTRLVVSEHNNFSSSMLGTPLKNWFFSKIISLAYRRVDCVVAVSNGVADDLAMSTKLSRKKIDVIYNPIDSAKIQQGASALVDGELSDLRVCPLVLGMGRLTAQKNFSLLIHAFAKVRNSIPARLMILGDGELRSDLEKLITDLKLGDDVVMPGFSANPFPWVRNANVFVLSSSYEGLPTVLIEAMACGTPVVSTDCPSGPAEILENGRWGRLVPLNDVDALAAAILDTLSEVSRTNVAERANDFSVDKAVNSYLKVLRAEV